MFQENKLKYEDGQLDGLGCQYCRGKNVSVYFDGPKIIKKNLWTRVYFFCKDCKEWDRTTYPGIPPHFDELRDIIEVKR